MAVWSPVLRLMPIDPYTQDDYLFDWGDFLNGANIAEALVEAVNATVTSFAVVNTAQAVACHITDPVDGTDVLLSCKITTDDNPARLAKRSVDIPVAPQ